jgi:hypothetical protein
MEVAVALALPVRFHCASLFIAIANKKNAMSGVSIFFFMAESFLFT